MKMRNPPLPRERKEYRLAEKLRRLRLLWGLTQREVAQATGIDESTVRNYELARRMPKPEHVRGLMAALEVFGYNDDFAYIAPTKDFFIQGIGRWAKVYEVMCKKRGGVLR